MCTTGAKVWPGYMHLWKTMLGYRSSKCRRGMFNVGETLRVYAHVRMFGLSKKKKTHFLLLSHHQPSHNNRSFTSLHRLSFRLGLQAVNRSDQWLGDVSSHLKIPKVPERFRLHYGCFDLEQKSLFVESFGWMQILPDWRGEAQRVSV